MNPDCRKKMLFYICLFKSAKGVKRYKERRTDGEKDGGLAAVALTIGEENVKGTDGGVDGAGGA